MSRRCCCRSADTDSRSMKTTFSGNAPGKQSMNRGSNSFVKRMDADTKAVDWWRHHQHHDSTNGNPVVGVKSQKGSDQVLSSSQSTAATAVVTNTAANTESNNVPMTAEQNRRQSYMGNQNSLEDPYEISRRELPIRPVNGNVLNPHLLPKENTTAGDNHYREGATTIASGTHKTEGSSSAMEIFEPHIDSSSSSPQVSHTVSHSYQDRSRDHFAVIAKVDSMDKGTAPNTPSSSTRSTPPRNNRTDPNYQHGKDNGAVEKKRKKLPLSKFMEKKSKVPTSIDASDHLSDVPSDVDSITKERYLLACQMLKTTMIQKETALIPIEKEFIMSLLGDFERDAAADESVVSEEQVSAIEKATLRLENDPVFQQPVYTRSPPRNFNTPSPSASPQRSSRESTSSRQSREIVKDDSFDERSDKNPHTATRRPKNKFLRHITNPCNPKSSNGTRGEVSHDVIVVHDDELNYSEWEDPDLNNNYIGELVRFDGWSHQRSAEYPFLILGADGDNLNPRVVTLAMMEGLRGFMPYRVSESNFWLKFSLIRDGSSLPSLLASVRGSTYTMIGVETNHGEVFGSFTGTPWRVGGKWFGSGESFLWRLKKPRYTSPQNSRKPNFEREMEVYPYTGYDDLVQYCTAKTIAVGGGDWADIPCPFNDDPKGIGFMIDGDLAGGETNSCSTFANPRLAKQTTTSSEFTITNLEVWTLTPCVNVKDAAKMEMQRLFLEEQGASMIRG